MSSVLLDATTVVSASNLLRSDAVATESRRTAEFDLAAVGQFIEALLMFDEVYVPKLDSGSIIDEAVATAGPAVQLMMSPGVDAAAELRRVSGDWISDSLSIEELASVIGFEPLYLKRGSHSSEALVLTAFGMESKYSPGAARWLQFLRSGEVGPRWETDEVAGRRLQNSYGRRLERGLMARPPGARTVDRTIQTEYTLGSLLDELGLPDLEIGRKTRLSKETVRCLGGGGEVARFCANIAWVAFRSRYYDLVSSCTGIPYMPHPIRARFVGFSHAFDGSSKSVRDVGNHVHDLTDVPLARSYTAAIRQVYNESVQVINERLNLAILPLEYPILLPYIANKARDRKHVLEVAYDVRESKSAQRLRNHLSELEMRVSSGDLSAATLAIREIDQLLNSLRRSMGIDPGHSVTVAVSLAGLMQIEAPFKLPGGISEKLTRSLSASGRRLAFLKDVFREVAKVASYGSVFDIFLPPKGER